MILSLQGCMAVGKTTAVHYLQEHGPHLHIGRVKQWRDLCIGRA